MTLSGVEPVRVTSPYPLFVDRLEQPGGGVQVVAAGELDLTTGEHLHEVVRGALTDAKVVDLDLSGITFVDSTGLNSLIDLRADLDDGQRLTITEASASIRRLLEITGLTDTFLPPS